jgi:hypothetical protein
MNESLFSAESIKQNTHKYACMHVKVRYLVICKDILKLIEAIRPLFKKKLVQYDSQLAIDVADRRHPHSNENNGAM